MTESPNGRFESDALSGAARLRSAPQPERYLQNCSLEQDGQPGYRRRVLDAAETFHLVFPLRQVPVGAVASVTRAAEGFVGLPTDIDIG